MSGKTDEQVLEFIKGHRGTSEAELLRFFEVDPTEKYEYVAITTSVKDKIYRYYPRFPNTIWNQIRRMVNEKKVIACIDTFPISCNFLDGGYFGWALFLVKNKGQPNEKEIPSKQNINLIFYEYTDHFSKFKNALPSFFPEKKEAQK